MKFLRYTAELLIIAVLGISPVFAMAAGYTGTSSPWLYDGSTQATSTQQQNIQGWRHQSAQVQGEIAALGPTTTQAVIMPVLFGVGISDISPNFGDPRPDGRTHEGEDIMATGGTPVVSPTAAVVLSTGFGSSEGNYVNTANPGGETFVYMHFDHVGEGIVAGKVLAPGDLIGYVGNTGDAAGGPTHLHFEIHNPSGQPTDPFPRLTAEFTIDQKISFLTKILTQTADPTALSQFLATNFRTTFNAAIARNISLPSLVVSALASTPVATSTTSTSGGGLPAGDLALGSSGSGVVTLQQFLISKATGPAAASLAGAGATGYFGAVTQAALIEYQTAVGVSPANGYYGPSTQTFVASNAGSRGTVGTVVPPATGTILITFSRNLYLGISGEDVRALQKLLNSKGFTVATSGSGSAGNETPYFGPATQATVIKFQTAYSIVPAAGFVGTITRGVLSGLPQ